MTATEKILLVWTLGSAVVLLLIMFLVRSLMALERRFLEQKRPRKALPEAFKLAQSNLGWRWGTVQLMELARCLPRKLERASGCLQPSACVRLVHSKECWQLLLRGGAVEPL
jgi:hypothetical protein